MTRWLILSLFECILGVGGNVPALGFKRAAARPVPSFFLYLIFGPPASPCSLSMPHLSSGLATSVKKLDPGKNCSLLCTSSTYGTQQDSLAHNPQSRREHAFLNLDIHVGIVSISTRTLAHNPQSRREHAFVKSHISM